MNTYVLLDEYIPEIKFKGKLLNSDVVTAGETVTLTLQSQVLLQTMPE